MPLPYHGRYFALIEVSQGEPLYRGRLVASGAETLMRNAFNDHHDSSKDCYLVQVVKSKSFKSPTPGWVYEDKVNR